MVEPLASPRRLAHSTCLVFPCKANQPPPLPSGWHQWLRSNGAAGASCRHGPFGSSVDVVLINEAKGRAKAAAHLLEFDSVHGHWDTAIEVVEEGKLSVSGKAITFTEVVEPDHVPWKKHGVSVVLECTGKFLDEARLKCFLDAGVSKVIVSAPVKPGPSILNVVMGVDDHVYSPSVHRIVTAASCTTVWLLWSR